MRISSYLTAQNEVNGLVMSFQDINKQKQVLEDLASAQQELKDLAKFPLENPSPVLRVDKRGAVIFANSACSMLGIECQPGKILPRKFRNPITKVLDTGLPLEIEVESKQQVFMLNYVPLTAKGYVNIYGLDITEYKKSEEALREAENDLNRAQAVGQIGSWRLDVQRNILLWSDENHRIFGIPKGPPMTYETFLSCVHPDDREYVDSQWQAALQGENYDIEHRILVGGEVRWVREKAELEFSKRGILKGGFGTTQDITQRKKVEEALRESEERFRAIAEVSPASIGVVDAETGAFLFVNPAYEKTYGYEPGELLGKFSLDIFQNAADRDQLLQIFQDRGNINGYELKMKRKDGSSFWGLISIRPINYSGKPALLGISIDITERKQVEELKDEFIGLVSHELRTPLTIITGSLLSALSPGISPEDTHELIRNATAEADSLAAILENMLELSRHQAGRLQLSMDLVSIREAAENVIEKLKVQGAKQQFQIDFPDNLPMVEADPMRVERILYNLIENATKYSPTDSEIRVSGRRDGDFIIAEIVDHGEGISPEHLDKLFEPFERFATETHVKGAGLGLVVCKRLVEAQSGWICVESVVGQGSTFSFALPIRQPGRIGD